MTLERILSRRLRQRILKFRRQPRPYRSRSMHTRTHRDTNRRLPFDWVKSIDRPLLIDTSATQRRIHALLFHSIIVALMLIELNEWTYQCIALWTLYRKSFGSEWLRPSIGPQTVKITETSWWAVTDIAVTLRMSASSDRPVLESHRFH